MNCQTSTLSVQGETWVRLPPPYLLAVSEQKKSGLILCKEYHAEFAGPGAAICSPVERGYQTIIAIGSPELIPVVTPEERQRAYSRRIQWARWLQKIVEQPDPVVRAEKILAGFEAFFGGQVATKLPLEAVALLVGVLPQTLQSMGLQQAVYSRSPLLATPETDQLKVTTLRWEESCLPAILENDLPAWLRENGRRSYQFLRSA